MGRPKGVKSGYTFRTAQEKFNIIKPIINGEISATQLGKELGLSVGNPLVRRDEPDGMFEAMRYNTVLIKESVYD